ncbi:MAG: SulP family inorganic anion transporter [Ilumatobacteraceae bacterium]|nr:SulP family inorganic anion transporter [Ilumatobacteraceae bacterium]
MSAAAHLGALLPRRADYAALRRTWRADLVAGLTVGVVALPLALAFGITSGLGADAGLITAIVAGLVAAIFGGSNVQVSGPTGAMTVVLVPIVARYGIDAVFVAGIMAGVLILAAGIAGFGRYLAFIPWPVIEGFTIGIAVIIFLQQVPAALGVATPEGENTAVVAARALADALAGEGAWWALATVGIVVATMLVVPRVHRGLPASLLAVVIATVVVELADAPVALIGSIPDSLPAPSLPEVSMSQLSQLFGPAVAIAALGALESLLSAKVADGMAGVGRHDPNRELVGQGLANLASPLFGGMPATGAIARTAVNVRAGAHTRLSAVTHAVVLVLVVLVGSGLVARIPLAALAGVLMVTAMRMVEVHNVRAIVRATRSDAIVLIVTAFVTIAFDLILAVEVGIAVAALLALRHVARTTAMVAEPLPLIDLDTAEELRHDHIVSYRLDGALFFGAVQRFLTELSEIGDVRVVILRLPELQMLDATGAQAIGEIIDELERRNVTVLLKGPRAEHERILREVGAIDRLAHERHLFTDLDAAIAHAHVHAARGHDDRATAHRAVP